MPEKPEARLGQGILNYSHDDIEKLKNREKELFNLRNLIDQQGKELDEYKFRLKKEQLDREKTLQKELEAREHFFVEREKKLFERQKDFEEQSYKRQLETAKLKADLDSLISHKAAEVDKLQQELQQEKERYKKESIEKIERISKDYVSETLSLLEKKEAEFHKISKVWGTTGAVALVIGLIFFGYVTIKSFSSLPNPVTWEFITFSAFKGLIGISFFVALAKYSLLFSNSYMCEALKNADRRHAINFGKFYLASYGVTADWNQIKEVFEHWNIKSDNAFSKTEDNKIDVTALEKFINTFEKIAKLLPTQDKDKD